MYLHGLYIFQEISFNHAVDVGFTVIDLHYWILHLV